MSSGLLKNYRFTNHIYMYKEDLALNNLQWLICHKTQPNQTELIQCISVFSLYMLFN